MINLAHYLEAARVQDLVERLQAQGYAVTIEHNPYDLVANKDNERIAFTVKSRSTLSESAKEIAGLREKAQKDGYTDFRLVIVSPPREKTIDIDGFEEILYDLIENHYYQEIEHLASQVRMENIVDVDIESIQMKSDGIEVIGTATLEAELIYGGSKDNVSFDSTFPISFDVLLAPDRTIQAVYEMKIDTADD